MMMCEWYAANKQCKSNTFQRVPIYYKGMSCEHSGDKLDFLDTFHVKWTCYICVAESDRDLFV